MKQAAKARLIKDYDKQTDIIFHLCDTCLTKCELIHAELKQINVAQKISNAPNTNMMTTATSGLQQQQPIVPPNMFRGDEHPFSPSALNINFDHQQNLTSESHQNTTTS